MKFCRLSHDDEEITKKCRKELYQYQAILLQERNLSVVSILFSYCFVMSLLSNIRDCVLFLIYLTLTFLVC